MRGGIKLEDSKIIDLYWARKEQALAETDAKYGSYCRTIARNILRNFEDTEECVSDTWLHAWNSMPPQRPGILSAFLGRITRNLSFDRCKYQQAAKRGGGALPLALDELGECIPSAQRVEHALEQKELAAAMTNPNNTFRLLQRGFVFGPFRWLRSSLFLFLRRYWYVDSISVIADRYGMKENTVKSILFRTREKLRKFLGEEGIAV